MIQLRPIHLVIVALVAVLALVAVWSFARPATSPVTTPTPEPPEAALPAGVDFVRTADPAPVEATAIASVKQPELPKVSPPRVDNPRPAADLDARSHMDLLVTDQLDAPVEGAVIVICGLRTAEDPGTWIQSRGDPMQVSTDATGRARSEYWMWADRRRLTRTVDLVVSHLDFPPFRDAAFEIGPGEHRIQLAASARVTVRGWTGSPRRAVERLSIQLESDSGVSPGDWKERDGTWTTRRVPAGHHSMRAASDSLFSGVLEFDIGPGESKAFELELRPGEVFEGQLGEEVPRPVIEGHVLLCVYQGEPFDPDASVKDYLTGDVSADGSFQIAGVPRGRGFVFILARGWVSKLAKADRAIEIGMRMSPAATREGEQEAIDRLGARGFVLQRGDIPQTSRPLIVAMERTGIVEVSVHDAQGLPAERVSASISPNVSFPAWVSTLVPWRTWTRETDVDGLARFDDVPPCEELYYSAGNFDWRRIAPTTEPMPKLNMISGKTAHAEVVVARRDDAPKIGLSRTRCSAARRAPRGTYVSIARRPCRSPELRAGAR